MLPSPTWGRVIDQLAITVKSPLYSVVLSKICLYVDYFNSVISHSHSNPHNVLMFHFGLHCVFMRVCFEHAQ